MFVSDRHKGICKYIRHSHPAIKHFFDQWHVIKGIVKKMLKAFKEKGCETIKEWTNGERNHILWCSTTTLGNVPSLILAKWKSLMGHIANKRNHPDPLFPKCAHKDLEPK